MKSASDSFDETLSITLIGMPLRILLIFLAISMASFCLKKQLFVYCIWLSDLEPSGD